MEKNKLPFGEYVKQKREALQMTIREFAEAVELSPAYLCDIEKGNRNPPEKYLARIAEVLKITEPEELYLFYDLAGTGKNGQHSDINAYIEGVPSARVALRTARDQNFSEEDWRRLVEYIKKQK